MKSGLDDKPLFLQQRLLNDWRQFSPPKKFGIFDKNSAVKIWSKEDEGLDSALPHAN